MNGGGHLELNGSPSMISALGQGLIADAKQLAAGIEQFRTSVSDRACLGPDRLGDAMRENAPTTDDIDALCGGQRSSSEIGEALGHGLGQVMNMLDEVVAQGEKNVESTKRAT